MFKIKLPFIKTKPPWKTIETIVFQSPHAEVDDPLIMKIEVRGDEYRKVVSRQIHEGSATEADKKFYLTKFLLVVEYVDAINAGLFARSFKDFEELVEQHSDPDIEVVEDGEYVQLGNSGFRSSFNDTNQ